MPSFFLPSSAPLLSSSPSSLEHTYDKKTSPRLKAHIINNDPNVRSIPHASLWLGLCRRTWTRVWLTGPAHIGHVVLFVCWSMDEMYYIGYICVGHVRQYTLTLYLCTL
jgi:hypothetical protein